MRSLIEKIHSRIVPELCYSQSYYEDHLREYTCGAQSWLDVGCGHQLLPSWRSEAEEKLVSSVPLVVGIDYDLPSLRRHRSMRNVLRADVSMLPFRDDSFDLVTANMVVEHLSDPVLQFREIARVLRPSGSFLFHTPNLNGYTTRISKLLPDKVKKMLARVLEERSEEDVFPTHYRANTEDRIREVATQAGLEVVAVHFTGTLPVLQRFPLLATFELIYIRQLMRRPKLTRFRQTLICSLRRPALSNHEAYGDNRRESADKCCADCAPEIHEIAR
jgi:ubiquinone/menaquinone biosynthesis C-methylase UbiE